MEEFLIYLFLVIILIFLNVRKNKRPFMVYITIVYSSFFTRLQKSTSSLKRTLCSLFSFLIKRIGLRKGFFFRNSRLINLLIEGHFPSRSRYFLKLREPPLRSVQTPTSGISATSIKDGVTFRSKEWRAVKISSRCESLENVGASSQ